MLIRAWESTLPRLARGGPLVRPHVLIEDALGRITVDAFPSSRTDRLLFMGYSGVVRLQPGTSAVDVAAAADAYRGGQFPDSGVTLLSAAGNYVQLPATDALALLVGHGCRWR